MVLGKHRIFFQMSDFLIRTMEVAPSEAKGGVRETIVIVILRIDTIFRKPR